VAASRTPQLDNFLKMEIQPAAKAADKELAIIQSHVLDGPIAQVANFLAQLYKEGYKYSSVNSYRFLSS